MFKDFAESDWEENGFESESPGIKIKPLYKSVIFLLRLTQLKLGNQPATLVMVFKK